MLFPSESSVESRSENRNFGQCHGLKEGVSKAFSICRWSLRGVIVGSAHTHLVGNVLSSSGDFAQVAAVDTHVIQFVTVIPIIYSYKVRNIWLPGETYGK